MPVTTFSCPHCRKRIQTEFSSGSKIECCYCQGSSEVPYWTSIDTFWLAVCAVFGLVWVVGNWEVVLEHAESFNPFGPSAAESAAEIERKNVEESKNRSERDLAQNLAAIKAEKVRIGMTKADVVRSMGSNYIRERVTDLENRRYMEERWVYYASEATVVWFNYDGRVHECTDNVKWR